MRGSGENTPVPPSASHTFCAECGRNGASRWFASDTACAATCSTVPSRAGSSLIFHGSVAEMYLLMSPTTRIASVSAFFWRWRSIRSPTVANAARVSLSNARSSSVIFDSSSAGISPKFLCMRLATRLTRLPQLAASSSLLWRTNSLQVKSASEVSGPATEM